MRVDKFSFGSIQIDGSRYEHNVIIDRGEVRKRKKKPSKKFREQFGHTPLSAEERIPWKCQRLVIGTGAYGRLPVMEEVKQEVQRRKIELVVLPTTEAIKAQFCWRLGRQLYLAPARETCGAFHRCSFAERCSIWYAVM